MAMAVRVVDAEVPGRRRPGRGGTPPAAVPQDLLDHVALRWLDEGDDGRWMHVLCRFLEAGSPIIITVYAKK
jgi:hypothetical protein